MAYETILYSVENVKTIIERIGINPKLDNITQIQLTKRQLKILGGVKDLGQITNSNLQQMLKISRQAVLKEMKKLINMELIDLVGKGRNAYYKLKY